MWASRAVILGYIWQVGDDRSIKFWKDVWFGNIPLSTYLLSFRISTLLQTNSLEPLLSFGMVHNFRRTITGEMMSQCQEVWDSEFKTKGGLIDLAI